MYKNEVKEKFCEEYLRSRIIQKTSLYGFFRKIEFYETELGKDVSDFTKEEAIGMYKYLQSRSVYSLMNDNTILKAYCAWLKYYGKAEDGVYETITIEDLKPCVNKNASKLLSREEITEIEDQLLNVADAAIIECLFEGIAGPSMRDITSLNANMLDKDNECIVFPDGRMFNVSKRLCELLEEAFEEEQYICYGETYRVKQLIGKGKLFKERDNAYAMDSDDRRFRAVYRKIQVIREYVGIKELTMKGIAASGMAHSLKIHLAQTQLGLKEFLQTSMGERLMDRYGHTSQYRVDNVIQKFRDII